MKSRFVRIARNLALVISGLYIVLLLLVYFFQEKLLFHPQILDQQHQFSFLEEFEEIFISIDDNVSLHGILFRAEDSKGLVFYLHGNGGSVEGWGNSAEVFTSAGYDLFILDYRGYGKSGGHIQSEQQLNSDVQKAFAEIVKRYKHKKIVIAGYSIGTGPAAHLAANQHADALVLQAPYANLARLSDEKVPLLPDFIKRYKFDTANELKRVKSPVFIFHGTEDQLIPYHHSVELKKVLGNRGVLVPLPGEGHNVINESQLFIDKLKETLQKI